ncbi:hypothetical protein P4421_08565 [Bacillus velezensis]|uniref:hypothetical protein n=1 Tax=Bacillus amyloliquefaciens group TaxID=1938374 RepID=UPI001C654282|nr:MULTISPECIES: hypothetical protein [Bacillus amyloliquefaciens group]MBW7978809.1 hypothetical protein [Bacillus velezensis]MCR4371510.1 hypothetical protein [Bacillus amyloliquefaciens]MED3435729.1 hypothetical protein [Bacillus velezensis]
MRLVLENNDQYFNVKLLLDKIDLKIEEYNWLISDLSDITVFKNKNYIDHELFSRQIEFLYIKGENLKEILSIYDIVPTFGVFTAVSKSLNKLSLSSVPFINENTAYWNKDYSSPVEGAVVEVGFFDSTDIIFTGCPELIVNFKRLLPNVKTIEEYLG